MFGSVPGAARRARYTEAMVGLLMFLGTALVLVLLLLTAILAREMVRPPRHTAGYAVARSLPVDPGELGFTFESWWLDRPDGARLPVWDVTGGKDGTGSAGGATVVFVHGWGHSRIDMLAQATLWSTLCDRLIFYDLRGHGESERGLSRLGWREEEDLLALLEALGEGPFMLVGFSMGAVIALAAAASSHPAARRIRGVVAYGPYLDFHRSLQGRLRRHHLPARPLTDLALLVHRLRGITPRSLDEADLARLSCPVLVVHGGSDVVAPLAHGRAIASGVPHGELLVVDEKDHALHELINHPSHDETVSRFAGRLVHPARESAEAARTADQRPER